MAQESTPSQNTGPDEEGIVTSIRDVEEKKLENGQNTGPDEEGIVTRRYSYDHEMAGKVRIQAPMKRGL